jgi:hypothetical protein
VRNPHVEKDRRFRMAGSTNTESQATRFRHKIKAARIFAGLPPGLGRSLSPSDRCRDILVIGTQPIAAHDSSVIPKLTPLAPAYTQFQRSRFPFPFATPPIFAGDENLPVLPFPVSGESWKFRQIFEYENLVESGSILPSPYRNREIEDFQL